MERYIGLDAHSKSCTFGVISEAGKRLKSGVVETNGQALVEFIKTVPGRKHLCLEEGTQMGKSPDHGSRTPGGAAYRRPVAGLPSER